MNINSPDPGPPTGDLGSSCHTVWLSWNPTHAHVREGDRLGLQTIQLAWRSLCTPGLGSCPDSARFCWSDFWQVTSLCLSCEPAQPCSAHLQGGPEDPCEPHGLVLNAT